MTDLLGQILAAFDDTVRYDRHGRRWRQWTEQRGPDAALIVQGPDGHKLTYVIVGVAATDLGWTPVGPDRTKMSASGATS